MCTDVRFFTSTEYKRDSTTLDKGRNKDDEFTASRPSSSHRWSNNHIYIYIYIYTYLVFSLCCLKCYNISLRLSKWTMKTSFNGHTQLIYTAPRILYLYYLVFLTIKKRLVIKDRKVGNFTNSLTKFSHTYEIILVKFWSIE